MSLICAVMSLLAIFGFSVMTFVPGPDAERERALMMIVATAFLLAWLSVAFWARPRHDAASSVPPQWLRHLLVGVSIAYLLAVLILVVG